MSTINRIFVDIFTSLSFPGTFPMTAPRNVAPREPAPQPAPKPQFQQALGLQVRKAAPGARAHRPAFG